MPTAKKMLLPFCAVLSQTKVEFFSSVHQMSKLVEFEEVLLRHMEKFIKANENKLEYLKTRLAELESDHHEALQEGPDYFESPINNYLLTKHLTMDWERVENLMEYESGKKSLIRMERFKKHQAYPEIRELDGAIAGLVRIQDVYRLKTADMARGILDGVEYNVELNAQLCFDVAKYAAKKNKTRLAHAWATETLQRLDNTESSFGHSLPLAEKIDKAEVLLSLAKSKMNLGDLKGANETYAELVKERPDVENYTNTYLDFQLQNFESDYASLNLTAEHDPIPENLYNSDQHNLYKYVCNGLFKQTPREERELRCGYLIETHAYLLIAPIKVEELNHDPLLVVYYDILSDAEIAIMKMIANNRIERAKVIGADEPIISPVRTSQFSFIPKTAHKVLQAIDVRAEDMTNLNMNFAENHQFQNYGIGGHYAQHYDWFTKKTNKTISNIEMGNRIATVLFYLTDVEQGGGTAFPYLKRLLKPKKGAAAFWYNLHANGERDYRTLHGGCPIIVGSKWVLNRWIREHDQSDRRPCDL
ncbi:PREDICTED: prolyl 4-hydroxylase subunit alpha-2 [Rhagoletis zephyria]|uniref:prolyl 4-hydroxylase subunit alpha-2 n=1 Tax=Rhagoletis zephyria TaxID=28612 RepID=UPI0008116BB6|nr:PREDICTED: prolyl 4-hydroxylase subunit alpha-2 [Rhagoletis zephyria]